MTLLTEEEARGKWCPFVRLRSHSIGWNRATEAFRYRKVDEDTACIASECMAWRWGQGREIAREPAMRGLTPPDGWTLEETLDGFDFVKREPVGYCGLAGGQP